MVKGNTIRRKGNMPKGALNSIPHIFKGVLFILILSLFTTNLISQEIDTLSMGENNAHTLKYLRSIASIEEENCAKAQFIEEYKIDLTSGKEVLIKADSWIKREPLFDAKNCNTLIPENSIVKIYSSSCESEFYAVKFRNKWGFVATDVVEQFE